MVTTKTIKKTQLHRKKIDMSINYAVSEEFKKTIFCLTESVINHLPVGLTNSNKNRSPGNFHFFASVCSQLPAISKKEKNNKFLHLSVRTK